MAPASRASLPVVLFFFLVLSGNVVSGNTGGMALSPCGRGRAEQREAMRGPGEGSRSPQVRTPHPARFARHRLPQGERVTECGATGVGALSLNTAHDIDGP